MRPSDAAGDVEFLFVDSIQTMRDKNENGWPGSPLQVRVTAQKCIELAKTRDVPVVMVGHITKSGQIAGPKLLEHMVDVVLFLRAIKLRATGFSGLKRTGLQAPARLEYLR